MSVKLDIKDCSECPFHKVQGDPDPDDWFNDDDEKVACTKTKRADNTIVSMCRPYQTTQDLKDAGIPKWCPLREK